MRGYALLLLSMACTAAPLAPGGVQTVPDATAAILKTAAVNGAREEIARGSDNAGTRNGIYLDTLVGPTPPQGLYELSHPQAWLDAMVATHKEPFPAGKDTLGIVYDWCTRRFPARRGSAGPASVWRDLFVRSDTGWARVGHHPAVAPAACTP